MFEVSQNGIIKVTRGDNFSLPLFINKGTATYPLRYYLKEGERVYFGLIEPNFTFEQAIIRKTYTVADVNTNGDVVIKFVPNDTVGLKPGKYYYEIKAVLLDSNNNEIVNTIVPQREFYIM